MITVLGLIYLTQATRASGYDYQANDVEQKISELTEQKKDLEVENARLTAMQTIKNSDVAKTMTKPADVQRVND